MKYLYFVKLHAFIKIGVTHDIEQRLKSFWTSCPYSYEVLAIYELPTKHCYKLEKMLHKSFSHLRHKGEWFRIDPNLVDYASNGITRDIEMFLLRKQL